MIQLDFFKSALVELASLQITLERKGGPNIDGELFEEILEFQDSLLQKFGLPISPDNEALLLFKSVPTENELEIRIKQLHSVATKYLLSNAKSELQVLRDAMDTKEDAMYVLPELKITTHTYTIFVFNEILLKQKDSVENILQDLKFSNKPEILELLGQIQNTSNKQDSSIAYLKSIGVKYIDQFINYK